MSSPACVRVPALMPVGLPACAIAAARMPAAIASWLDAFAARRGAGPATAGVVHSVFPGAINVRLPSRRLLALHGPGALRAPFALALERWPLPAAIAPGARVDVEPGTLSIGQASVALGAARRVDLRAGSRGGDPHRSALRPLSVERSGASVAAGLLTPHAAAATRRLADGLTRGDTAGFADAATTLIGLGEGLTPAGDDCVVGVLAVLHATVHPMLADAELARRLRSAAWTRTTDLGREFLLHAIDGAFAECVLDAVSGEPERVARGVTALLAHGASSGADTLHGLSLAARATGRPHPIGG